MKNGALSGVWMDPKQMKALVLGCTDGAQKRALFQSYAPHQGIPSRNTVY
jgi:hypothetical protein